MSKSVVTAAAAAARAKHVEKGKKLAKQQEEQQATSDDGPADRQDADSANAVQTTSGTDYQLSMSGTPLGGFSFAGALGEAADSVASLTGELTVQDGGSDSGGDGDGSGTILLIGAIGLVGAGAAVLAGGGGGDKNAAPTVAATQAVSTNEDTAKSITVSATDPDGDTLTYTNTAPANGTLTGTNGSYTFTPAANFNGTTSFTVTATDPDGLTATQTITVTVVAVNDAPTLAAIAGQTTAEDTAVTFAAVGSDIDLPAQNLTYAVANAVGGTATVTGGNVTFTPTANFNGAASVQVTVTDGTATSAPQTVAITVIPVNDAPFANPNTTTALIVPEDSPGVPFIIDFDDVEGDPLTVTVIDAPDHGTFGPAGPASSGTYIPNANFFGTDSFTYRVSDGVGGLTTQTVNVTVTSINDAPVFNFTAVSVVLDEDTSLSGTLAGTASDVDVGDVLTYGVETGASKGSIVVNANGTWTYTPNANANGSDSFVVKVTDSAGAKDTAVVNVTINPLPEPVNIDVGVPGSAVPFNAAGDQFEYQDNPLLTTEVVISGFGPDDVILVSPAPSSFYAFGPGADTKDLVISYNNQGQNTIVLDDVLVGNETWSTFNEAQAEQFVGHNFFHIA